jgi:hypothetical protein
VIGSTDNSGNGHVHFYNLRDGTVRDSWNVGSITGLVSLGDSGRVAIAAHEHVFVMDSGGNIVDSIQLSSCLESAGISGVNARPLHGLSLFSIVNDKGIGSWRFVLPAIDTVGFNHRLLAYLPSATNGGVPSNCSVTSAYVFEPVAPLVVTPTSRVLSLRILNSNASVGIWNWTETDSKWDNSEGALDGFFASASSAMGVAGCDNRFWATVKYVTTKNLLRSNPEGETHFLVSVSDVGAVALDAAHGAYVVVQSAVNGNPYQLRRYLDSGAYEAPDKLVEIEMETKVPPVGSPILGEPIGNSPAEVYVVMTDGSVHAFEAESFKPLWTRRLGINIAPTAQPLLHGNRLWVIGTQGELRGVAVNSNGLSKEAEWPTMHRDNCNSSSHISTAETLPSCF